MDNAVPTYSEFAAETSSCHAEGVFRKAYEVYGSGLAVTTSFGIQSAVLLHMLSSYTPQVPVIWIDTGYLPKETYVYAEELVRAFQIDLRVYQSPYSPARMEALFGRLWESGNVADLDRYHEIRKIEPLERAFSELNVTSWITGVRRDQTTFRRKLPRVADHNGIIKIHPLIDWSDDDITTYFRIHKLPEHPLQAKGYVTVGDAHSSKPETKDLRGRGTRFGGKKEECGIHVGSRRNRIVPIRPFAPGT